MARMSIDDKFLRDPRVTLLAARIGESKFAARGRLLEVFAIAYDRVDPKQPNPTFTASEAMSKSTALDGRHHFGTAPVAGGTRG